MSIYQVRHYSLDVYSVRAIHKILPYKKYMVDAFIKHIETYIEDYYSVVKSSLDIPQAKTTATQLENTMNNINQVLHDLQTLPTFGVPLLKAKASFSGLGYLPKILDQTQLELMQIRDLICWTIDNIRGETNHDTLHRLRTLIANVAKTYKSKFDKIPMTDDKAEFMRVIQILFLEIDQPFSKSLIEKEVGSILDADLSVKY